MGEAIYYSKSSVTGLARKISKLRITRSLQRTPLFLSKKILKIRIK